MNPYTPKIESNSNEVFSFSIRMKDLKRPESQFTLPKTSSRSSLSSLNLLMKPSQVISSSRPSKYFSEVELKPSDKVETYRQHLLDEYKQKSHRRMKRFQSNGILPYHLNMLRKDSLLEVEINKKYLLIRVSQFKKTMFTQKCLAEKEERRSGLIKKLTNANDVLEKLKTEITRQQCKFVPKSRRDFDEERDLDEFAGYVEWLNTDGKKKYEAHPISLKNF